MSFVNVNHLKEGMVLAEDLYAPKNRFLLAKDTTIAAKHITTMKSWGVKEANIVGISQAEAAAAAEISLDPRIIASSKDYVDRLFPAFHSSSEFMIELRRLSMLRAGSLIADGRQLPRQWEGESSRLKRAVGTSECRKGAISPGDLIKRQMKFISFPEMYYRIVDVLEDPLSSASHLAGVVSKDPSLSSKLLRLVNSPFYGFPSKIDSITRAISLIGAADLTNLAIGISVVNSFKMIPPDLLDVKAFWRHSLSCGVIARILAAHKMGLTEERFFVAGLIHDIGRLVLIKECPEAFRKAMALAREKRITLYTAEKDVFGFDHAMVGSLLMKDWGFPSSLERPVRFHHMPGKATSSLEPAIIHVADSIAAALQFGQGGSLLVPPLDADACEIIGVTSGLLEYVFNQAERQFGEIQRIFLGGDDDHEK